MPNVSITSAEFPEELRPLPGGRDPRTSHHHQPRPSIDEYRRLKSRDRDVLHVTDLSDDDMTAIRNAVIPEAFAAFDHEVDT